MAANKLDDYEEGTWVPQHSDGTGVTMIGTPSYTRIGNSVTIQADIQFTKTSSSIKGLPFSSISNTNQSFYVGYSATAGNMIYGHMGPNSAEIGSWYSATNNNYNFVSGNRIMFSGTYLIQ